MSQVMQQEWAEWAQHEFGQADLGDLRRTERLMQIATVRAERPSASLPEGIDDPAALKGLYRFMENDRIEREAVLTCHYRATAERCAREAVVLAVQDTTEVDYTHHPATAGLGVLGDRRHRGFLLHSTLAITPAQVPLGLLDQQVIYRSLAEYGKRHQRKQRPIAEKESRKWLDSLERTRAVNEAYPDLQLVSVGDREADVYDLFWRAEQWHHPVLVRGCWNRGVVHEERYLWDFIEHQPVAGHYGVTVPRQGGRREREATVTVRYGRVPLKPPVYRAREHLPTLPVDVVLAREEDPPAGVEPLQWLLITTVAVAGLEQALERIQWYTCRWGIEVYHKVLKSGCRIEDRQFEDARTLERYLAIDAVVAWRVMGLTRQSRETPELPCDVYLDLEQWQALACYKLRSRTPPKRPPTLAQATQWIAELGGYQGRRSGGPPGVTVVWRGLQRLDDLVDMWRVLKPQSHRKKCGQR